MVNGVFGAKKTGFFLTSYFSIFLGKPNEPGGVNLRFEGQPLYQNKVLAGVWLTAFLKHLSCSFAKTRDISGHKIID